MSIPPNFLLFFYDEILAIVMSILPIYRFDGSILTIWRSGALRGKGGVWEKLKKRNLWNTLISCDLVYTFWQHFAKNPIILL